MVSTRPLGGGCDPCRGGSFSAAAGLGWVGLGWVGFDPTNCLLASERHVRTAIGRDYADVPPTRGIFRRKTASELSVAVRVTASVEQPELEHGLPVPEEWSLLVEQAQKPPAVPAKNMQQEQQQQ